MSSVTVGNITVTEVESGFSLQLLVEGKQVESQIDHRDAATLERFLANAQNGDARTGFRVPVQSLLPLISEDIKVTLVHKGTIIDTQPVDISLTGMLLRVHEFEPSVRSQISARIILKDFLAKIEAEVVRVDHGLLALHFTECMQAGELNPPQQLAAIFNRLEQMYLQQRD